MVTPNNHAIVKTIGCYPQTDGKNLLVKTTHTQCTEHAEVKLMPT